MPSSGEVRNASESWFSWLVAMASMIVCFASFGLFRASGVLYVETIVVFNLDREAASWPFSICVCFYCIAGALAGALLTFFTARAVVIIGLLFTSVGMALCFCVQNIVQMSLFYGILFGTGVGLVFIPIPLILNEYFNENRVTANGIFLAGGPICVIIISPISELLIETFGLRGTLLLLSTIPLQTLAFTALLRPRKSSSSKQNLDKQYVLTRLEETMGNKDNEMDVCIERQPEIVYSTAVTAKKSALLVYENMKHVLLNPNYHVFTFSAVSYIFVILTVSIVLVDYGEDKGLSRESSAVFVSLVSIPELFGRMCSGWVTDKGILKRETFLILSEIVSAILLVVYSFTTNVFVLYVVMALFWFTLSCGFVIINVLFTVNFEKHLLGMALGLKQFATIFAFIIRPRIIGFFRDSTGSYSNLFQALGALLVFSALLVAINIRFTKCKTNSEINSNENN